MAWRLAQRDKSPIHGGDGECELTLFGRLLEAVTARAGE